MATKDATLQCPRCQRPLTPQRGELGEAACGGCGGRYLGSHAVQRVLVEEQGFSLAFLRELTQLVGAPRLACPECQLATAPIPLRGRVLDLCLGCGGLWADAGELTAVTGGRHAHSDAPGPMPPPPPPPRRAPPPGPSRWPGLLNMLVWSGVVVAALLVVANLALFAIRFQARGSRVDQDRLAYAQMRARRDAVPPVSPADHNVLLEAARAFLKPRVPQWAEPGIVSEVKSFNGRCGLVTLERGGHHFRLFADFVDGDGWLFSLSRPSVTLVQQRPSLPGMARIGSCAPSAPRWTTAAARFHTFRCTLKRFQRTSVWWPGHSIGPRCPTGSSSNSCLTQAVAAGSNRTKFLRRRDRCAVLRPAG